MSTIETKGAFYFCPTCNNVAWSQKPASFTCCGEELAPLPLSEPNERHTIFVEVVGGDFVAAMKHPMTEEHFINALIAVSNGQITVEQFTPDSECVAHFPKLGATTFFAICNLHGLFVNDDFA